MIASTLRHRSRAAVLLAMATALLTLVATPSARADFGFLPGAAGFDLSATELDGGFDSWEENELDIESGQANRVGAFSR